MGNAQNREVDVLELYMDTNEHIFNANSSGCGDMLRTLSGNSSDLDGFLANYTEIYSRCFNGTIPSSLFSQPYLLPWYQQLLWTLLFATLVLVAVVGNATVAWIIVAHRRMRTVTNLFLLNLAVADFLLASGNAAFNFVFMLNSHWPFGQAFCVASNFLAGLTVSTSVFTILAMSLDRFVAVTRPLRPRMSKTAAYSIILSVWALSSLLSVPSLLYATTITYRYADEGQRTLCFLMWPDHAQGKSYAEHVYNIVFLVVTYVVPMTCMAFTYTWIGCILWGSKVIGESSDPQDHVIKAKQRVVHMLVAIMLLFGVCWLPYHIYFLYTYYNSAVLQTRFIQHVYLAIYWLAMSNSCYNPIVYYIMNARFRGYFQKVMCFRGLGGKSPQTTAAENGRPPLHAKASLVTSNRTKSYRMSHLRRKTDCEQNHQHDTPM